MDELNLSTPLILEIYEAMSKVVDGVPVGMTDMEYCVEVLGELIADWHENMEVAE